MNRDPAQTLPDYLLALSDSPVIRGRISNAVLALQAAARRPDARTLPGSNNDSVAMRIRKFHNELRLGVTQNCDGAIWRSGGAIDLGDAGAFRHGLIHCEHVVPASIIAGFVFDHFQNADPASLLRFLLLRAPVCAVTIEERKTLLTTPRSYDGSRPRSWSSSHPEFPIGVDPFRDDIRPFRRYSGTGMTVVFAPTGEVIDTDTETYAKMAGRLADIALYDPTTYAIAA